MNNLSKINKLTRIMYDSSGMGHWSLIYTPINDALSQLLYFLQLIGLTVAMAMVGYYKVREMFADVQEDQMFAQKSKKIFGALIFLFLVPTLGKIVKAYFYKA